MPEIREAVMVDYARTPFGLANRRTPGFFADRRADDLATIVIDEVMRRTGIDPSEVEEVIMGAVNQSGEQASPGRMVGLMTCPADVASLSVERACGSSMTGAHIACMAIQLGMGDIYVVGGMESHSRFPTPLITEGSDLAALADEYAATRMNPNPRVFEKIDIMAVVSMGLTAEKLAEMYGISREEQDRWAVRSNLRAAAAQADGKFENEIVPMEVAMPDGTVKVVNYDQGVRPDSSIEKIRGLPPLYKPDGTICAASASGESDGAAAAVFMSKEKARQTGLVPMVTVRGMAWSGVDLGSLNSI